MRRSTVALIVLALAVLVPAAPASAARDPGLGVPPGTPVFVRLSPDNNVINAVIAAAASAGLGPVTVDHFRADCSAIQGQVVVCRDINLIQTGQRTVTLVGMGFCVVSLDPRVGGATVGTNHITRAMRKCVNRRATLPVPEPPRPVSGV